VGNKDYIEYPYKMISSDDIKKAGYPWYSRDTLPYQLRDQTAIYNLDYASGPGTHWVTFAVKGPIVYYVDPFGSHLKGHDGKATKELIQRAKDSGMKEICGNEYQYQDKYTWLCGYYALYFASKLNKNKKILTPETFDKIVQHCFDKYPTDHNIKIITEWAQGKGLL
jgi:hypothetical protein